MARKWVYIPDRSGPGLTTTATNADGLQGIRGKYATAGHKSDKKEQDQLRIATVNVGTLVGRSREVVEMLARRNIDFCCIQEVQYYGEGCKTLGDGEQRYKLWWAGEKKGARGGVGILVREEFVQNVMEIRRITPRIIAIKIVIGGKLFHILSVYAPQSGRPEEEKEEFWEKLDDSIGGIPEKDPLIIGGDLNGHIGMDRNGFEDVMGIYSFGERNAEGEKILEFCQSRNLNITNTMFKKSREKKITYKSEDKETQIDYILIKGNKQLTIKDCKVIPGESCLTQHRLLCGIVKIAGFRRNTKKRSEKRIKQWKLKDEAIRKKFEAAVERMLSEGEGERGWGKLRDSIIRAGKEVCSETSGIMRHKRETWWWNETVQNAIRDKKESFKKWQISKDEKDRETYKQKKIHAKKTVAEAKRTVWDEWAKSPTVTKKTELFRIAKQMKRDKQDITGGKYVKDSKGEVKVEEKEIMERWKEYFKDLLNEQNDHRVDDMAIVEGPLNEITEREVETALKRMKKGKAAGPTGITSDMLKAGGEASLTELTNIMNTLIQGEEIPKDWKSSSTIPIYKGKGDSMNCSKYRGIRLLEHGMKVYESVLEKRLREHVSIGNYQFGFCPGRSTTGAIFIIRQLQEKYNQKKKNLYHIFVDLEKAFDRVPREVIEWALRKKEIPERMIRAIMALYVDTTSKVKTTAGISEEFGIGVGVHQGSVLSPLLFIIAMDEATKEVRTEPPWELAYADDLVLTAETQQKVTEMFEKWKTAMETRGLKVNLEKTVGMVTGEKKVQVTKTGKWPCACCGKGVGANSIKCKQCNNWCHQRCSGLKNLKGMTEFQCPSCKGGIPNKNTNNEDGFAIIGGKLEVVKEFRYLGDVLDNGAGVERAVRARVAIAWTKWREIAGRGQ